MLSPQWFYRIVVTTKLLPDLTQLWINIRRTKRLLGVCPIVVLKTFQRRFEVIIWKRHGDNRFFKVALQRLDLVLDGVCLGIGKNIDSTSIFAPHLMLRRAGVGPQVDVSHDIQWDDAGVERHDNGFGIAVMWSEGLDESLLHFSDTTERLKHRFSAPVAATTKPYS